MLKDHANGTANIAKICVAELRQILAVNDDAAAGRAIEQIDAANERALTGAGSTDDAEDFSWADRNRDVLERLEDFTVVADVGLCDVFEFDHEGINGSDISEMSENTNCQQTSRQFVVGESIDWSVLLGADKLPIQELPEVLPRALRKRRQKAAPIAYRVSRKPMPLQALDNKKARPHGGRAFYELVGTQGFEPWTDGLRVRCSTN